MLRAAILYFVAAVYFQITITLSALGLLLEVIDPPPSCIYILQARAGGGEVTFQNGGLFTKPGGLFTFCYIVYVRLRGRHLVFIFCSLGQGVWVCLR
jgi:hypothetical protein